MAITGTNWKVTAKARYTAEDGSIKNRTITVISDALETANSDNAANQIVNLLQPLTTDSLTGEVSVTRVNEYTNEVTVPTGLDYITDTKDQIMYKISNAEGSKTVTISHSAAVDPTDTSRWATLTAAVTSYGNTVLSTYTKGDYAVETASLRAYTDYDFEE